MSRLLHEELLLQIPLTGEFVRDSLAERASEVMMSTNGLPDPNVSVLIRSRNNVDQLEMLLEDVRNQRFDGEVEVVLVDTESTDGTVQVGKDFGATIVPVAQHGFTYPNALNRGFAAASHPWVYSFVDHSLLSNDQILRIATRSGAQADVAGVSGITLPNANASWVERAATAVNFPNRVRKPASTASKLVLGFLATNASLISKEAWAEVGGFDEAYAAGGEDGAFAKAVLEAGHKIVVDPAMSVHHTHGLGLADSLRQFRYWTTLSKPQAFSQEKLAKFRKQDRTVQG